MLAIRLPTDIEERLDRLAKATGCTKTFYDCEVSHLPAGDPRILYRGIRSCPVCPFAESLEIFPSIDIMR